MVCELSLTLFAADEPEQSYFGVRVLPGAEYGATPTQELHLTSAAFAATDELEAAK